jgi:AbrB family looped-hinge helix DNA binding protein
MRVTRKGQVTIPLAVRDALGIRPGSEVRFELDGDGARLVATDSESAREAVARMRGAGDVPMTTDEILALTRA